MKINYYINTINLIKIFSFLMQRLQRVNTLNRVNTYLPKEYFKVILVGTSYKKAQELAQWLTGSTVSMRGMYGCSYNKTQMVVFFRSPEIFGKQATTVAVEALLVFVDSEEELEYLLPGIQQYAQIPVKILISTTDMWNSANTFNASYFPKEDEPKGLKDELNRLDLEECKRVKEIFLKYDTDMSGMIDQNEMKLIASDLGENPDTDEFKQAVLALDYDGNGQMSFTEFIAWWKIGRQNTKILPKIYQLHMNSQEILNACINFESFCDEIVETIKLPDRKTCQKIYYHSPGVLAIKSIFELGLALGGQKRVDMCTQFLSSFTKNASIAKNNWLSIVFTLKKNCDVTPQSAKEMLEEFKDNLLLWGQTSANPAIIEFLNNFLVFETSAAEHSTILAIRLKIDIEELIRSSLYQYLFILNNLFDGKTGTFWFNCKGQTSIELCSSSDLTIRNILNAAEFFFEGEGFRNRLKTILNHLTENGKNHCLFKVIKTLLLPVYINIEYEGNVNDLSDPDAKKCCDFSLNPLGTALEFLKKNLPPKLLQASHVLEFGLNIFDIFAKFKIYTKSLFS